MIPDLFSLALFVRAVEAGSVSKAAAQSNIALGAASRRISTLEARYRVKLLTRSAAGVRPTPAGEELLAQAREILDRTAGLTSRLGMFAQGTRDRVRLDAIMSAITQFLADDLYAFMQRFPGIEVRLQEQRSDAILAALRARQIDIGIVIDGLSRDGLASVEYRRDQLVVVVPSNHPLRSERVKFGDIIDYDHVGLDASAGITRLLMHAALMTGAPLRLRAQASNYETLCKLVQAGFGIGIAPDNIAGHFASSMNLRIVRLSDPWSERRMFMCYRDFKELSQGARRLVRHLSRSADMS